MSVALNRIAELLGQSASDNRLFPPTLLYEEGWMLRLVLDWFSTHEACDHPFSFHDGAKWFSEARFPSVFLPRYRGDTQAEGFTHADGVIGQFRIGSQGQADFALLPDATQFKVLEAKMFSGLSRGTTRAPSYHQAARNVACMAEILRRAGRAPSDVASLGFYVVAPQEQIDQGVFGDQVTKESIEKTVRERVENHDDPDKVHWYDTAFLPTLCNIDVRCIGWEDVVDVIRRHDSSFGPSLAAFYSQCLDFNRPFKAMPSGCT